MRITFHRIHLFLSVARVKPQEVINHALLKKLDELGFLDAPLEGKNPADFVDPRLLQEAIRELIGRK